jgi:hypothetical protein
MNKAFNTLPFIKMKYYTVNRIPADNVIAYEFILFVAVFCSLHSTGYAITCNLMLTVSVIVNQLNK